MESRISPRLRAAAIAVLALLVAAGALAYAATRDTAFRMFTQDGVSYARATVSRVVSEQLTPEEATGRSVGAQELEVAIASGPYAGETVQVDNNLTATHNVLARTGTKIVLKIERQPGVEPFYSVFNYDRLPGTVALVLVFAASMVVVGGCKGLRSLAGLAFALVMVAGVLLPAIFSGVPAIPAALATAAVVTVFSMLLLNGWSAKTFAAICATVLGLAAAMGVYLLFSALLQVSGFNQESAEELIVIAGSTGLDVCQVLFAGVLIASLGAVMDMCMSIATSLFELQAQDPQLSPAQLVASAFTIGRDMIGTMCQTLILAFAGTSMSSLLVLTAYGVDFNQLLSSDYMAVELLHSFVGGIAVVLCVPITALVCRAFMRPSSSPVPAS